VAQKCKTGEQTLRFLDCDDCTVQDVRITRSSDNALRATGDNDRMIVRRVTVDRSDPINGRAPCLSSPSGGPQNYCGAGGATIEGCLVIGTGDDGIGYFSDVATTLATNGLIQDNTVRDNQTRGIIITLSDGGLCRSNTLIRNCESAINVRTESGTGCGCTNARVRNWTITQNTILQAWVEPVISLNKEDTLVGLHDNIDIVSNTFVEAPKNNHII
jgi:parallel beta-helix repeat protein